MADLPIKIGMKGVFKGQPCTVISKITFSMKEDGEKYYWDEWEIKLANGKVVTLEFDDGRWKTMAAFSPSRTGPIEQARAGIIPFHDEAVAPRVTLVSRYVVESFEGHPSYAVNEGDSADYLDAEGPGILYSAEWKDGEIEYFRGGHLSRASAAQIFPEIAKVEEEERRLNELLNGPRRRLALAAWIGCIVAFLGGSYAAYAGARIENQGLAISAVPKEGARFGPFALRPEDGVYRLTARATLTQSSAWISAVAERADELEISASAKDMWQESGHDAEGQWHESDLSASRYFVVRQPASYFIRLYAEPGSDKAQNGYVSFELEKGAIYPDWLFIYSGLCGLIGLFCSLLVK